MKKCSECRWFNGSKCTVQTPYVSRVASSTACSNLCSRDYFTKRCSCCRWFNGSKCTVQTPYVSRVGSSSGCGNFSRW